MNTPRRAGYREVWMGDPAMRFRCGTKVISLVRHSGGGVRFVLSDTPMLAGPSTKYEWIHIETEEKFQKLWDFLESLKEVEE